jgi:two-component system response regulator DesR
VADETDLIEAGVSGMVHKDVDSSEIVDAVRAVANGARLIAGAHSDDGDEGGASPLNGRERGILTLVAAGSTNAEIAEELFFATKTVERYVATIVGKLGARNRAHAAALAVSRQLIDVDGG